MEQIVRIGEGAATHLRAKGQALLDEAKECITAIRTFLHEGGKI